MTNSFGEEHTKVDIVLSNTALISMYIPNSLYSQLSSDYEDLENGVLETIKSLIEAEIVRRKQGQ